MKYELSCRCPECGKWNSITTNSLNTGRARFRCCNISRKLRVRGMWNVLFQVPGSDEKLNEFTARLNKNAARVQ